MSSPDRTESIESATVGGARRQLERVDLAVWVREDMRQALAAREVGVMFRLLQRYGMSQRQIVAMTGQSEISDIIVGRRKVTSYASYELLMRIADGGRKAASPYLPV